MHSSGAREGIIAGKSGGIISHYASNCVALLLYISAVDEMSILLVPLCWSPCQARVMSEKKATRAKAESTS